MNESTRVSLAEQIQACHHELEVELGSVLFELDNLIALQREKLALSPSMSDANTCNDELRDLMLAREEILAAQQVFLASSP